MRLISKVISLSFWIVSLLGLQTQVLFAEKLYVAGGCFWCVEADFESVKGVREVVSGFTGGTAHNPTYKQVTKGNTGHREAVLIEYDANQVSLDTLINLFLRSIDPTDKDGQFCDRGFAYTSAIYISDTDQRKVAEKEIRKAKSQLKREIATPIIDFTVFYEADSYHQDFYKGEKIILTRFGPRSQASAYKKYRDACGRDKRVKEIWGSAAAFVK